jgi:hypothetical protein
LLKRTRLRSLQTCLIRHTSSRHTTWQIAVRGVSKQTAWWCGGGLKRCEMSKPLVRRRWAVEPQRDVFKPTRGGGGGLGGVTCQPCGCCGEELSQIPAGAVPLQEVGDERHLVFTCPALEHIRLRYRQLFTSRTATMVQFLWQDDLVSVSAGHC